MDSITYIYQTSKMYLPQTSGGDGHFARQRVLRTPERSYWSLSEQKEGLLASEPGHG